MGQMNIVILPKVFEEQGLIVPQMCIRDRVTSVIMVLFIGHCSLVAGVVALVGYIVVGAVIPLFIGKKGAASGMEFRSAFGDLNSFILDSLRGLDETIQYGGGKKRMQAIDVYKRQSITCSRISAMVFPSRVWRRYFSNWIFQMYFH